MGAEKNFENQIKRWLESEGIYPLGTADYDKLNIHPRGYYEKRWGGGYSQAGLPDLHIVVNGINVDVEVKSSIGKPSELQKHNVKQINYSWSMAFVLYPEGFDSFKEIMKGLIECDGHIPKLNVLKSVHSNSKCDTLMNLK